MTSPPTALSLCYAAASSGQYAHSAAAAQPDLHPLCRTIGARHNCTVVVTDARDASHRMQHDSAFHFNIILVGEKDAAMAARAELLSQCPLTVQLNLSIPANELPTREECDSIAADTHTSIAMSAQILAIVGTPQHVLECRIRLLLLLDQKASLRTESVLLPLKLHNLVCGRRRANLQPIIEETATNVYLPSPFYGAEDEEIAIHVSGDANAASRAKEMLKRLADQKARSMYHKKATFHARKLDWMWFHCQDDLHKMMYDNGSFIQLPPLGSGQADVVVYAENRVNAERTLRALNALACTIYEALFYFKHNTVTLQNPSGANAWVTSNSGSWQAEIADLSRISGAEVVYHPEEDYLQVLGSERAIRNAYQHLQNVPHLVANHASTTFKVESAREHRDFISGKKDGKISKIVSKTGANITYKEFSDYNFVIEVTNSNFSRALDGLSGLQEELPAEISFYVPETYHKRIIGVRGSTIQTIMKRYGVYVKFSNTEEFAALGGYVDNEDNVVARTPMKNQIQLENLRHAVLELVPVRDRNYVRRPLSIPFRLHRKIASEHADMLAQEYKAHHARLWWPENDRASDLVTLVCPEAEVEAMIKVIEPLVPTPIIPSPTRSTSTTNNGISTAPSPPTNPVSAVPSPPTATTSMSPPRPEAQPKPPSPPAASSYPPSMTTYPFPRFIFDSNGVNLGQQISTPTSASKFDPQAHNIISHAPMMNPHSMTTLHNPELFTPETNTPDRYEAAAAPAPPQPPSGPTASSSNDLFSLGQHDPFAPTMDNIRAIFDRPLNEPNRQSSYGNANQQRASLPSLALPQRGSHDIWASLPGQSGPGATPFRGLYPPGSSTRDTTASFADRAAQGLYGSDWSFESNHGQGGPPPPSTGGPPPPAPSTSSYSAPPTSPPPPTSQS